MLGIRSKKQAVAETTAPEVYPTETAEPVLNSMSGETCARCDKPIGPSDEARRTATGGCVHLSC